MAKSRRTRDRERRAYKAWLRKQLLKKLRRTEEAILEKDRPKTCTPRVDWEIVDHPLKDSELVLGIDMGNGEDQTVVISGTKTADGKFIIRPSAPGKYRIVARVNEA